MAFDVQRIIAAHQAGIAERQNEADRQKAAEDRQFQIELQKHQLKALQLQDKAALRGEDIENLKLATGGVAPSYTQPAAQTGPLAGNPGGAQPQDITNTLPPQVIHGIQGPDTLVTPQSLQDIAGQKMREFLMQAQMDALKPYDLAPGATRHFPLGSPSIPGMTPPGTPTGATEVSNPPLPDFELKSGTSGGKPVTVKFDKKTGKAVSMTNGQEVHDFQEKVPNQSEWDEYVALGSKVANGTATQAEALNFKMLQQFHPNNAGEVAAAKNQARIDKSYNFHTRQLGALTKPIDDRVAKFRSLEDSINAGTPMADALVAPQLLSLVAGGAGSGLRMNEAEISRIVGGRSNWETIKAGLNKWNTDPNKANSILANQRGQIEALIGAIGQKLQAKQDVLSKAQQDLADSEDPSEHKQIFAKARSAVEALDSGKQPQAGASAPPKFSATGPNGQKMYSDDGKTWRPRP